MLPAVLNDLPNTYKRALPEKKADCIEIAEACMFMAEGIHLCRAWFVGRVIVELQARKEKRVYEDLMEKLGLKRRILHEFRRVYIAAPSLDSLQRYLNKGLDYKGMKLIASLDPEHHEPVLGMLETGKTYETVLAKAQLIYDKAHPPKDPKPTPEPREIKPLAPTMAQRLKEDAPVPSILDALDNSMASASRAADGFLSNVELVIEKAVDTVRTDDMVYGEGWRKATLLISNIEEVIEKLGKLKDRLGSGIPAPDKLSEAV